MSPLTSKQSDLLEIVQTASKALNAKEIGARASELAGRDWIGWDQGGVRDSLLRLRDKGLIGRGADARRTLFFADPNPAPVVVEYALSRVYVEERFLREGRIAERAMLQRQDREERHRERAQHRHRWAAANHRRSQLVSFDYESAGDFALRERIADPSRLGQDPFHILTGTTSEHLQELLGDLGIEDIGRMDEWELERLRERILEAGLAPSSVQRRERERLKVPMPHHGQAPSRTGPTGMAHLAKQRSQKDRSARHKATDKRYKRRENERPRDGWGGVLLP